MLFLYNKDLFRSFFFSAFLVLLTYFWSFNWTRISVPSYYIMLYVPKIIIWLHNQKKMNFKGVEYVSQFPTYFL